jgi:hypothetical protein
MASPAAAASALQRRLQEHALAAEAGLRGLEHLLHAAAAGADEPALRGLRAQRQRVAGVCAALALVRAGAPRAVEAAVASAGRRALAAAAEAEARNGARSPLARLLRAADPAVLEHVVGFGRMLVRDLCALRCACRATRWLGCDDVRLAFQGADKARLLVALVVPRGLRRGEARWQPVSGNLRTAHVQVVAQAAGAGAGAGAGAQRAGLLARGTLADKRGAPAAAWFGGELAGDGCVWRRLQPEAAPAGAAAARDAADAQSSRAGRLSCTRTRAASDHLACVEPVARRAPPAALDGVQLRAMRAPDADGRRLWVAAADADSYALRPLPHAAGALAAEARGGGLLLALAPSARLRGPGPGPAGRELAAPPLLVRRPSSGRGSPRARARACANVTFCAYAVGGETFLRACAGDTEAHPLTVELWWPGEAAPRHAARTHWKQVARHAPPGGAVTKHALASSVAGAPVDALGTSQLGVRLLAHPGVYDARVRDLRALAAVDWAGAERLAGLDELCEAAAGPPAEAAAGPPRGNALTTAEPAVCHELLLRRLAAHAHAQRAAPRGTALCVFCAGGALRSLALPGFGAASTVGDVAAAVRAWLAARGAVNVAAAVHGAPAAAGWREAAVQALPEWARLHQRLLRAAEQPGARPGAEALLAAVQSANDAAAGGAGPSVCVVHLTPWVARTVELAWLRGGQDRALTRAEQARAEALCEHNRARAYLRPCTGTGGMTLHAGVAPGSRNSDLGSVFVGQLAGSSLDTRQPLAFGELTVGDTPASRGLAISAPRRGRARLQRDSVLAVPVAARGAAG